MRISGLAKSIALEIADRVFVENIGVTRTDVLDWLCSTADGRECLREEVRARTKRSTKRTYKSFSEALADDAEGDDADDDADADLVGSADRVDASDVPDDLIERIVSASGGSMSRL